MSASTVADIRARLAAATPEQLPSLAAAYADDPRAGVRAAVRAAIARIEHHARERERVARLHEAERELHALGYRVVAGVDEVGRGSLAGPVSAGAVVLPDEAFIEGLDDSKRLSPARRREVARRVREVALGISVAHVPPTRIDAVGIGEATAQAMREALDALPLPLDHALVDGLPLALPLPTRFVVGGDGRCAAIAAASVVAKVTRDALMAELDEKFPGYDLAVNKGYGSAEHLDALRRLGLSPIHRRSFAPCAS